MGIALLAIRLIFQLTAALIGISNGLWSGVGYPSEGNITITTFHCTEQINNAFSNGIKLGGMKNSFFHEVFFALVLGVISISVIYYISKPENNTKTRTPQFLKEVYKDPLFLKLWIITSSSIFLVDLIRYFMTSVFAIEKSLFAWSSFCIAGTTTTIIDKFGSFYEAGLVGLACALIIFKLRKKFIPDIDLWHEDGECGYKYYALHCFRIGTIVMILTAVLSWIWGSYIQLSETFPDDFWYLLTPVFGLCILIIIFFQIVGNAFKISIYYSKRRQKEIEIIEAKFGKGSPATFEQISNLPPDPMEQYLGRHGLLIFRKIITQSSLVPLFLLIGYLSAQSEELQSWIQILQEILKNSLPFF